MRKKEEILRIFAFEDEDIAAGYSDWISEGKQEKYLVKISCQIGWIIIEFNRLEWQLHEIVKKYLCNESPELNALFFENISNNSFYSKVDLLKKFFKQYYLGDKKHMFDKSSEFNDFNIDVDDVIKALKGVAKLRNKYAHCFWHRLSEDHFVEFKYKIKSGSGLEKVLIRFNPSDLKEDFENLGKAQYLLIDFESKFDEIYSNS